MPLTAIAALLAALLTAGCQSNAQQDLVARELRMQEDQLYAMENYLEQYQQLVCKYRSENAALRRRLDDDYYDEADELPEPRTSPRRPADERPMPESPIEAPDVPRLDNTRPASPHFGVPVVPPLEGTTSDQPVAGEVVSASHEQAAHDEERIADNDEASTDLNALYETEATAGENVGPPIDELEAAEDADGASTPQVWLHGEVVENDMGGGPRLAVNVDYFDELASHTSFEGTLSLMLVGSTAGGGQQSLARWDFDAEAVNLAIVDAAFEPTMRFHLELPADTPINESTELWVRLVAADGPKLLAHTPVALNAPSSFSSRTNVPAPNDEPSDAPILASNDSAAAVDEVHEAVESTPSIGSRIAVNIVGSDWTIARPNEPANLPIEAEPGGGWRASSEIIPTVVQSKPSPPRKPQNAVQQATHTQIAAGQRQAPAYKRPTWSPDRAPRAAHERPTSDPAPARRPAWSATR